MERNPFFYEVDTAGNQLPYIDRIQMTARREPGGAEPPGHRRPVRPPGAPHGHDQAPGVPGEPGQGRLRRQARPGAERLRRHAPGEPRLRGRSRDRQVAPHRRLPAGPVDGHRPRPAQRDVLARDRRPRLGRAGGLDAVQPGAGVAEEVVDARRQAGQRPARQDRPLEEGRRRATGCGRTARGGSASSCRPRPAPSSRTRRSPR